MYSFTINNSQYSTNHKIIHTIHLIIYHSSTIHPSSIHLSTNFFTHLSILPSIFPSITSIVHHFLHSFIYLSLITYLFIHFAHPYTVPSSTHPCTQASNHPFNHQPMHQIIAILPPIKFPIHSFHFLYQNQEMSHGWSFP